MAKGQYLSNYQQKIVGNYYNHRDTIFVTKLATIVSDLSLTKNEKEVGRLWAKAKEFLGKTSANPVRAAKLLQEKNLEELARVVNELTNAKPGEATASRPAEAAQTPVSNGGSTAAESAPEASSGDALTAPAPIAPDTLKAAMTAFRKRLKLTVLSDESRLSPRVMTGGRKSEIVGIVPPDQWPREVWDELAKQGKLKYTGQGFYELGDKT